MQRVVGFPIKSSIAFYQLVKNNRPVTNKNKNLDKFITAAFHQNKTHNQKIWKSILHITRGQNGFWQKSLKSA